MAKTTPKILSGFMELMPSEQAAFNKIKNVIAGTYERFGFLPLDTPVLELAEVLLAKAGGETEKQIYRFTKGDTDIAMRFDLTVPLARFVSMHQNQLTFPFKRYQIGKVYRGERAQRGRFREFYQCDIDVIGNETLDISYDAEIIAVIYSVFENLGLKRFLIKLNNRKILKGFFVSLKLEDKINDILRIIDKLDKIGTEAVRAELMKLCPEANTIDKLLLFISQSGTNQDKIAFLKGIVKDNEDFLAGVDELEKVLTTAYYYGVPEDKIAINLSIARGLDYYTGTVYETELIDMPEIGSVCSGGRYDDLTGFYSDKKMPGVGISIGLTRLFSQLLERGMIKSESFVSTVALVLPVSENENKAALRFAALLRNNNVNANAFTENKKFKAKMNYADKLKVPFAVIVGETEVNSNTVIIRDMQTGEQKSLAIGAAVDCLVKRSMVAIEEKPLYEVV